ncbi:hypothetical protein MD588_07895 [Photobacterium sp. SDRW27]|uniref:hypothetical protein n=1 Tax=Photobacterium obscurum TaxID=2829490 RepID=UPI0022431330|nr:hypothetical protein [Photobacterium obscurum]MCW8328729.1 hypothetical protein [Photobacterium obscurum]
MKYILLLLISFPIFAQDQVHFSFGYKANTKSTVETETVADVEMSIQGDIDTLPEEVVGRFPVRVVSKNVKVQSATTGEISEDGKYPIESYVLKDRNYYSVNGSEMIEKTSGAVSLEGLKIKGEGLPNGKINFLSAEGANVTEELKEVIKKVFTQAGELNDLNNKTVRLGESISVKLPMVIPMNSGDQVSFDMDMKYTLNRVDADIAYFDITYFAVMEFEVESGYINVKGSGYGTMLYDIENTYMPESDTVMTMEMLIPNGSYNFITKTTSSTKMITHFESGVTKSVN